MNWDLLQQLKTESSFGLASSLLLCLQLVLPIIAFLVMGVSSWSNGVEAAIGTFGAIVLTVILEMIFTIAGFIVAIVGVAFYDTNRIPATFCLIIYLVIILIFLIYIFTSR